jgi:hypothetical protein
VPPASATAGPSPSLVLSSPNSPGTTGPSLSWLRHIVATTGKGRCEKSERIIVSLSSERAFPIACRSCLCPSCQRSKWAAARALVSRGILAARERGEHVRFVTLTSRGAPAIKQFSACWDDLAKLLRAGGPAPARPPRGSGGEKQAQWRRRCKARRSFLREYALVLEVGPRGSHQLHAHVLMTGRFIPQRQLSAWAKRCGFGKVAYIQDVQLGDAAEVAAYASKLAGYGSKAGQEVAKLKKRAGLRLRPLRTSRGWCPGGLRKVEEDLGIRNSSKRTDAGPWVLIRHDSHGRLLSYKQL